MTEDANAKVEEAVNLSRIHGKNKGPSILCSPFMLKLMTYSVACCTRTWGGGIVAAAAAVVVLGSAGAADPDPATVTAAR